FGLALMRNTTGWLAPKTAAAKCEAWNTTRKIGLLMGNRRTTQDVVSDRRDRLGMFFAPKNVAVIGATEHPQSVGRTVLWNLIQNPFGGTVYPVNLKRPNVLGIKAYPSVAAI